MYSPAPVARRSSTDTRELQRQLNASLEANQDLQQQKHELQKQYNVVEAERASLLIDLELTRAEASDYRQYYSKWQTAQKELEESKRQQESMRSDHEAEIQGYKAREKAAIESYHKMAANSREDWRTIKALKAENLSLKGQKERNRGPSMTGDRAFAKENVDGEHKVEDPDELISRQNLKRNHETAFENVDHAEFHMVHASHHSPLRVHHHQDRSDSTRHPLSDSSHQNSPVSQRISKRANLRHDTGPESPLPPQPIRVAPVSTKNRILAEESQPESQFQETQETVPLEFDETKSEPPTVSELVVRKRPTINLHDQTTSKPLVSPDSETKASALARAKISDASKNITSAPRLINLHDKTTSKPLVSPETETVVKVFGQDQPHGDATPSKDHKVTISRQYASAKDKQEGTRKIAGKTGQASTTPPSDRSLRSQTMKEQVTNKEQPTSVKREIPVPKLNRVAKQETPLRSESSARSTTPATGSADKRKLLPIKGWKGGRSSRALAKKDSFEDDDGFGYQASVQAATMKRMREISLDSRAGSSRKEPGIVVTPVQAKKSGRLGKNPAIPAHMTTEMNRSRTTGSTSVSHNDRSSPSAAHASNLAIHSNPMHERSGMTPLGDRDRNVRRGSEASPDKSVDVKKLDSRADTPRLRGGKTEDSGMERDTAVGGSKAKPPQEERFEINPDRNQGLKYAYQNVERRKEERKKLTGHGCIECENYYNAVGEMPVISRAPIWRSPSPESKRQQARASRKCPHGKDVGESDDDGDDDDDDTKREVKQKLKNRISRHREDWSAPTTPPGYWNIGFPSTQDVAVFNEVAEQQREAKRLEMRREAEKKDGRYRRVAG